jgi:hypothetical protein
MYQIGFMISSRHVTLVGPCDSTHRHMMFTQTYHQRTVCFLLSTPPLQVDLIHTSITLLFVDMEDKKSLQLLPIEGTADI